MEKGSHPIDGMEQPGASAEGDSGSKKITRRTLLGGILAIVSLTAMNDHTENSQETSPQVSGHPETLGVQVDQVPTYFGRIAQEQYRPKSEHEFENEITEGESLLISYFLGKEKATAADRQQVLRVALEKIAQGLRKMPESYAGFNHVAYSQKFNLRFVVDEIHRERFVSETVPVGTYEDLVRALPQHLSFALGEPRNDPMEEKTYSLFFYDQEFVDPAWIVRVTQAVRSRDESRLRELAQEREILDPYEGEDSTEIFQQLLSGYATERSGRGQIENAVKHLGSSIEGKTWAEVGFGSGKVFSSVREKVGPSPKIYGVEVGEGQQDYVERISETLAPSWGEIEIIDGSFSDSKLPANSVDIIHMAGVHLSKADKTELEYQECTLPWLRSMRMALKSGGVLIMQDAGQPGFETVDKIMREAGFELHRLKRGAQTPAGNEDFTVSYKASSEPPQQVGVRTK